jgi:hypothetical protein
VLPFHGALFEPAVRHGVDVWAASISYSFRNGAGAEQTVAYYGDDTLMPHLMRLAGYSNIVACVRFAAEPVLAQDRSAMAILARSEVTALLGYNDLQSTVLQAGVARQQAAAA